MALLVQPERIKPLNNLPARSGKYVLYWMQQSQRAEFNHALEYAAARANELNQPLLVVFGLMDNYPEANARHYQFMLEGLKDAQAALAQRGIAMVVQHGPPAYVALSVGQQASLIVCDRGYLRHQKEWRREVAESAKCEVVQIEGDTVVPVEVTSNKAEYAARTIRPKIHKHVDRFLIPLRKVSLKRDSLGLRIKGLDLTDVAKLVKSHPIDSSVEAAEMYKGGATRAQAVLKRFLSTNIAAYSEHRNRPETDDVSHMSKYLHFGQISPVDLALQIRDAKKGAREDIDTYLEELIVRRELSCNFCEYTSNYDSYNCLPDWAKKTLSKHVRDRREHIYSRSALENAKTADPYWNAAMNEMRYTGYMHNYMRMYWGKKILEWSPSPEQAYETTLHLNNKYFIDGRDPISFANVAWIFGLHDRPWGERPIFGTVRYMAASGLERKCDIDGYVRKVERLIDESRTPSNHPE